MAKVTNVNIDCSVRQGAQLLFDLKVLLLANGWTITATSDGTNVTNGASPDRVSTVVLFNVANAYYVLADPSGTCWIYVQRGADNVTFTVKVSRVAPQTNGTATVMPTTAVAANETTLINNAVLFQSAADARGHLITYDAAENAAGVRPFYLLMTSSGGGPPVLASFVVEAIATGTYDALNAYPWVAAAGALAQGLDFTGARWTYYYSPTNVFVSTDWSYPVYASGTSNNTAAPSPWGSGDTGVLVLVGKGSSQPPANVLGLMKNIRLASFYRAALNTLTTAAGERYIYAVYFLIPYANGVTPL